MTSLQRWGSRWIPCHPPRPPNPLPDALPPWNYCQASHRSLFRIWSRELALRSKAIAEPSRRTQITREAYNGLAWLYATAPEPLRDTGQSLAMAQKAVLLAPQNSMFRNTLGVAYYRAGRYRETVETLQANLDGQLDRFLAWDMYFLAMSHHRLGEKDKAREYRNWAVRWSRNRKGLSPEHLRELADIREEADAVLGN